MRKTALAAVLCWTVAAQSVRVIDGDTFIAVADIWPGLMATMHVRVLGVNTPEKKGETVGAALKAQGFTESWLSRGEIQMAVGCDGQRSLDNFGRTLGKVTRDGKNLADDLIGAGLGVKYP